MPATAGNGYLGTGANQGREGTGRLHWEATVDDEGHRSYIVRHRVQTLRVDGPAVAMTTDGLPTAGSTWNFGTDEQDDWAYCLPRMKVSVDQNTALTGAGTFNPLTEDQPAGNTNVYTYWLIEQTFTTKPLYDCRTATRNEPWLELPKVSGSFSQRSVEARIDRNGKMIRSSSWEPIHGPQAEFDESRPTVIIEWNSLTLDIATFSFLVNCVNANYLWGLPPRCVKLSNVVWARNTYGTCTYYYTKRYEFDINYRTFDRVLVDEGTKALGRWEPGSDPPSWTVPSGWSASNPGHFSRYRDQKGEISNVMLAGNGLPINTTINESGTLETVTLASGNDPEGNARAVAMKSAYPIPNSPTQYYPQVDFGLLGIPYFHALVFG